MKEFMMIFIGADYEEIGLSPEQLQGRMVCLGQQDGRARGTQRRKCPIISIKKSCWCG